MYQRGATSLHVDCCCSELALSTFNGAGLSWTKQALSHDITEQMLI